jgi:alpha-beta hydrolase superfamily lysophospholipase
MINIKNDDPFFIRDATPEEKEASILQTHFPKPSNWHHGIFGFPALNASYYYAPAKRTRAVIVGLSGACTHYFLNPPEMDLLNDLGFSVIWLTPPNAKNLLASYTMLAKLFLTHESSPAWRLTDRSIPHALSGFSTGGLINFALLQDQEARKGLENYRAALYLSPFFGAAGVAPDHSHPIARLAFEVYSFLNRKKAPRDTLCGRIYLRRNASHESFSERQDGPTPIFQQITDLRRAGAKLVKNFDKVAANSLPSIFVVGDKDQFACPKTTKDVATGMEAPVKTVPGAGHDVTSGQFDLIEGVTEKFFRCVSAQDACRSHYLVSMPPALRVPVPVAA